MDKEFLKEAKIKLQVMAKNLKEELSGFAKKNPEAKGDWKTAYPDMQAGKPGGLEAAADEVEQYSTNLPIEFSLENQLKNVEEALERIENKTYGMCENCKQEMPRARLLAMPEAKHCADCAGKL